MSAIVVERTTGLTADPDTVWRSVTSMDGINAELRPLLRMSAPIRDLSDLPEDALGRVLCTAIVWAFVVIPYDRMKLRIVELDLDRRRFVERSDMLWIRAWQHERWIDARPDGGCTITDRLTATPRVGLLRPVVRWCIERLFRHRHRRLAGRFG